MLTVQQIKQSCPGCDAEFIVAQQEAGHNLDECRDAWMQTIAARLQNREQTIEEMRKQTKPADTRPPGVEPLRSRGRSGSGSAKEEWDELVCEAVNRTGGNRMRAVQLVNRENPGLRESMLDEVNA